jgi:hypothetical protein
MSVLQRSTNNCPWSGDLWAFYIRYLGQMDNQSLRTLFEVKESAINNPWLSNQPAEISKFYLTWISICRMSVVNWEDETADTLNFMNTQLEEAVEYTSIAICFHGSYFAESAQPEACLLGKLAIQIYALQNREEEARGIWDNMKKNNGTKCDYWLDRISWEKYLTPS